MSNFGMPGWAFPLISTGSLEKTTTLYQPAGATSRPAVNMM